MSTSGASKILLPTLPSLLIARNTPFIHRDISWLQFNERVLGEARQSSNPLLERAKFLAITSSNLDEFFMIRFSSLNRSIQTAKRQDPRHERRLVRIRANLLEAVTRFGVKQSETLEMLTKELGAAHIYVVRKALPESNEFSMGKKIFEEMILPHLSAPEPFSMAQVQTLENLQLGVHFNQSLWFKIPRTLPWVYVTNDGDVSHIFFLDDLLRSHLAAPFRITAPAGLIRITRDADFTIQLSEEDSESIPDMVKFGVGVRDKGKAVRLQWLGDMPAPLLQRTMHAFRFIPGQIFPTSTTLGLHGLWVAFNHIAGKSEGSKTLRHPPLKTFSLKTASNEHIFEKLNQQDFLFHHPYDAFDSFVSWIETACADPRVESIDQTIYRMDVLSPIMTALKKAAQTKKVRVIIELRARFDELNNLQIADELRKAGVEVAFGFGRLKLHAKVALISRKDADGPRLYTHLSTGNYNSMTARQYTDLAILTSNYDIGLDAKHFFDSVWAQKVPTSFKRLVSAPSKLHRKTLNLIEAEISAAQQGRKARIVAKVNALVDESLIQQLYAASQAGVQVDLIVRGACSLIPGVKGLSENIRVVSIVDRFLEHSRIYYFGDSRAMYLSSADWMPRNFFSRLEIAFPVLDPRLYRFLEEVLIPAYLSDTAKARELTPQGTWKKRSSSSIRAEDRFAASPLTAQKSLNAQSFFEEIAANEYKNTPLE